MEDEPVNFLMLKRLMQHDVKTTTSNPNGAIWPLTPQWWRSIRLRAIAVLTYLTITSGLSLKNLEKEPYLNVLCIEAPL